MVYFILLLQFTLASCTSFAQPETLISPQTKQAYTRENTFYSSSTKSEVKIAITYPGNFSPGQKYPLAIFLHGRGGDHFQFKNLGGEVSLQEVAEETKLSFLVISVKEPKHSYWKNGKSSGTATMVTEDLIEFLRKKGLEAPAKSRALFGISMGGHGALYLSQIAPHKFHTVYALSPVFRTFESLFPEDRSVYADRAAFEAEDPVHLYQKERTKPLPGIIEMGKEDPFLTTQPETLRFLQDLQRNERQLKVDLTRPGAHDAVYWKPAIKRALHFFAQHFFEANPKLRDSSSK